MQRGVRCVCVSMTILCFSALPLPDRVRPGMERVQSSLRNVYTSAVQVSVMLSRRGDGIIQGTSTMLGTRSYVYVVPHECAQCSLPPRHRPVLIASESLLLEAVAAGLLLSFPASETSVDRG
ncbi:hypothetical protein K466DRAFT_592992 [Polyporus arcularius HHB13444]|uniref:Secreted protein n=1 Tax=Polyporus arcularius HHB13444 TaxID=1314778 RepID=A0A5C3NJZ2_9APHY|nr:hypothetical protein K466DRAFT_592992 [Polyporus arcularius HHB13444]